MIYKTTNDIRLMRTPDQETIREIITKSANYYQGDIRWKVNPPEAPQTTEPGS